MSGKEGVDPIVPKFSSFRSKEHSADGKASDVGVPSVPNFASFKGRDSKEDSSNEGKNGDHGEERRKRRRSEREHDDSHRHHSKRHRDHHHHRSEHRTRSRSRSPRRKTESRSLDSRSCRDGVGRDGGPKKTSDVFFIDKKGDPLIARYGGIERSKIPPYRRYGGGQVLGTPGRLIIHRDGPRDQFSLRMPGEGSGFFKDKDGLRDKRLRLRQQAIDLRPRRRKDTSATGEEEEREEEGFLSLSSSRSGERHRSEEDSPDETQPNYRSIEGKAKARTLADSEAGDDSGSGDEDVVPLEQSNPLKWRSVQLSRRVKDNPEDIDAWIELVEHQDVLLRAGQSLDYTIFENEAHSYSEIKVSILESALPHTSNPRDRSRVLNYLMREGVKVWNSKTAAKKWSEVERDEEHNFILWKIHLDFCTSDIASFEYDQVRQILVTRLRAAIARSSSGHRQNDFSEAIYVFLRATRFIHDAGYKELAVAAWQALLELTFFRPNGMDGSHDSLVAFQEFWESEVPRIGEGDALGWRQFAESGSGGDAPDPVRYESETAAPVKDAYKAWAAIEQRRATTARLPARTMDEGTEDDPFRVVMFADIEPLLFIIPDTVLPHVRSQLLDAFLLFCGLPPYCRSDEWTETAWLDPFLTGARGALDTQGSWEKQPVEETADDDSRQRPAFSSVSFHAASVSDNLFQTQDWFGYLGSASALSQTVELGWACNVTRRLALDAGIQDLAAYHLALSSLDTSSSVKKVARMLLKQYPTNLGLYNAYAMAEYAQGNRDVAAKVLSSAGDIDKGENPGSSLLLWRSWAWIELESGHRHLAVKRLCSSVDEPLRRIPDDEYQATGSQILKARLFFASPAGEAAPSKEGGLQTHAECLALLAYLTTEGCTEPSSGTQGNIAAAMDSIDRSCHELKFHNAEGTLAHEGLLQFAARLLYFNATRGPSRRAYTREQLTKFLTWFPQNTMFLSLLEWSDSSLRVVDETRALLRARAEPGERQYDQGSAGPGRDDERYIQVQRTGLDIIHSILPRAQGTAAQGQRRVLPSTEALPMVQGGHDGGVWDVGRRDDV
ncbi:Pfam:DUF1740 [Geosmithia morbida]|uniref:Pfam:DUF1740 n=1 Tax=Geosmithia morbida TaxID=1094350 RepID=A0A9P4YUA5_9HYPO|nr:Pfam:DUF1740 [Geosmithia morbida]KAF4121154.1 Pfam:DUF1740 [Geosmithia morbida]